MNSSRSIHSWMRSGSVRIFWGIVVTLFLFSCSQNPLSVADQQSEKVAASSQTPIHQILVPPTGWNGNLVVFAHGFVPPIAPLQLPPEAAQFRAMAMSAGFAFATTSYPTNGMVITEGLADLVNLVAEFKTAYPQTQKVFLIGASMGGLIAAQAAEKHPGTFNGVLAICGVYGSFLVETAHLANFHAIFDYFFPGIIPGDAVTVPMETMLRWQTMYVPQIGAACSNPANSNKVRQLLAVTKLPVNTADPQSIVTSIVTVLSLGIYATEDVKARLGGQPFGNRFFWYFGSDDDRALNAGVKRYQADPAAVIATNTLFGTTGKIQVPVVTLHSTGDHIAPISQQLLYGVKIILARKTALYTGIPVIGFGHCVFDQQQLLAAFGTLVAKVTGVMPRLSMPNQNGTSVCIACKQ